MKYNFLPSAEETEIGRSLELIGQRVDQGSSVMSERYYLKKQLRKTPNMDFDHAHTTHYIYILMNTST